MTFHPSKLYASNVHRFIFIGFLTTTLFCIFSCKQTQVEVSGIVLDVTQEKMTINQLLDSFNIAAANANFDQYFNYYTDDAIFTGTDATERWNKTEFMDYAKPHFDKGKAWNFKSLERHIYLEKTGNIAWFDELLDTQMKICRGSGVLQKIDDQWKIQQYILSITMPNDSMDVAVGLKTMIEDALIAEKYKMIDK